MVDRDEQVGFHFQIDDNSMAATHGLYSGSSHSSTVRDLFLSSKPQVHHMNDSYNSPRAITECGYGWVQRRWQGGIRLVPGGNSQESLSPCGHSCSGWYAWPSYKPLLAANLDEQVKVSTPYAVKIILEPFLPSQAFSTPPGTV